MVAWLYLLATAGYALALLLATWHWARLPVFAAPVPLPARLPSFSVVLPVRNEAVNLPHLLTDLAQQGYLPLEVLVSDDHSTDDTIVRARAWAQAHPHLPVRVLPASPGETGKKAAIARAVAAAQGEWVATTDGDCRLGPDWLANLAAFAQAHQPKLMVGPVVFLPPQSLAQALLTVEFASLIGVGGAALQAGRPHLANGANLAYPRAVFAQVGGYAGNAHLPSGDDEFLLQKIQARWPGQVRFIKSPGAVVQTAYPASWGEFWQQRRRWASKWRQHRSVWVAGLALAVFGYHLLGAVAWLHLAAGLFWPQVGAPAPILTHLLLKCLAEALFLGRVLRFLGRPGQGWAILAWQPLYPWYALAAGLLANRRGYVWKGRPVRQ
jgi:cellulose synthase/poly-beta-1,6-N-acetylglucosamine synthase-like glycosyltransferase